MVYNNNSTSNPGNTNNNVRNIRKIQIPAAFLQQEQQQKQQSSSPVGKRRPRSRPTNHRYQENISNNMSTETNSLRLPSRDREMPSAVIASAHRQQESSDAKLAARLQQQFNDEETAHRMSQQEQGSPRHPRNTPQNSTNHQPSVTNNNTDNDSSNKKKPDKLIVGLIIALFAIGTITLGLLQFQHGQDLAKQKKQPRIFDDYFVDKFNGTIILKPTERLQPGEFASSPSGQYRVGLTLQGDLVLQEVLSTPNKIAMGNNNETNATIPTDKNETVMINETAASVERSGTADEDNLFSTRSGNMQEEEIETTTIWNAGVTGAAEVYLQTDGNLILKTATGNRLWSSGTHQHSQASLIVDDGGRIGVRFMSSLIWMQGVPQGTYRGPSSYDLTFPVRGAFYYAWYPQTWKVSSGDIARFKPDLGYYVSGDPTVVDAHIDQLEYGKFDVGIISWFGPGTNLDIARITNIMDRTLELNANIKWTIYYEDEWALDPNQTQLRQDFEYIKKYFAWHPTYAHVDGKPLIFIWNEDDCEVVDRWVEASNNDWYIIPKLFGGYGDCPTQPNQWHQYGPASAYARFPGHSVSISPGFWHAREPQARLPRLSESQWCDNVRKMVQSGEPWQLVTTFNEQGEGTSIESTAAYWPSESGYGYYLDCLHFIP